MRRETRATLSPEMRDTTKWAPINCNVLVGHAANRAIILQDALRKYLDFEPMGTFLSEHKITHEQLLRALNRCVAMDGNGNLYGWNGLILHLRTKGYQRLKPIEFKDNYRRGGRAGALGLLFSQYPSIEEDLEAFSLTGKRGKLLNESRVSVSIAHNRFIALCKEQRIQSHEWPFNTKTQGKTAIANWLHQLYSEHYDEIVEREYGEVAGAKSNTGKGIRSEEFGSLYYDRWQVDEHSENILGAVEVDTPTGPIWFPAGRATLIAVSDPNVPALMGYSMSFARAPDSEDFLDALDAALGDTPPHEFHLDGMHHVTGGGFPAQMDSDLRGYSCAVLEVDNALVHLAKRVVQRIRDRMGCTILFGPVQRFECRAFVESVFSSIERAGFLRCPFTTGTQPKDPRRQQAEEKAAKFKINASSIKDLTESLAGACNVRGEGPLRRTASDEIRRVLDDPHLGFLPTRVLPLSDRNARLGVTMETLQISGSRKRGQRPHVYLDNAAYQAEWLSDRWDLIGKEVLISFDRNRFRTLRVFLPNGVPLGDVTVTGWWSKSEHTRAMRKQLVGPIRDRRAIPSEENDPIVLFFHCQETALLASKRAHKKIASEAASIMDANHRGYGNKQENVVTKPPATDFPTHDADAEMDDDEDDESLPTGVRAIN